MFLAEKLAPHLARGTFLLSARLCDRLNKKKCHATKCQRTHKLIEHF